MRTGVGPTPDDVRRILARSEGEPTPARVTSAYRSAAGVLPPRRVLEGSVRIVDEIVGAGPLQRFLDDPSVCDVLVHSGGAVWVDRGDGLRRVAPDLPGEEAVRVLAVRLLGACGRRLDAAAPYADGVLPSGHRVHAVIPPVAIDGTCVSVRPVRPLAYRLADLEASGSVHPRVGECLRGLLHAGAPMVITGRTGSGKTTLLAALLAELDSALRLVVVEDSSELRPPHPQLVRLQARAPNVEGVGAVGVRDLVRQALRMRPDRLVLGEVRGPEIVDLLVALNTGHRGGLCTLHANSAADVPARVEALGLLAGVSPETVRRLLAAALRVVVHLDRRDGAREVAEIAVLASGDPAGALAGPVAQVACSVRRGRFVEGPGWPALMTELAGAGRG
jgi:pilus assembly protein CpaF